MPGNQGRRVGRSGGPRRDDEGRFTSTRGGTRSRQSFSRDEEECDVQDSAGRCYSEDSWERAQEGRARGGRHSHDNQFTVGRRSSSRGRDEDDAGSSRASGRRGSSGRYEEDEGSGRGTGRRGSSGRYEEEEGRSGGSRRGGFSARYEEDDEDCEVEDSAGRCYSEDSWERAQEGRARGGRHSHDNQFTVGRRGSSRGRDEEGRSGRSGGRGSSSSRSRGGEYTDSAGRHYTRESWERAQQGRALGGQHSHGGGRPSGSRGGGGGGGGSGGRGRSGGGRGR